MATKPISTKYIKDLLGNLRIGLALGCHQGIIQVVLDQIKLEEKQLPTKTQEEIQEEVNKLINLYVQTPTNS